MVMSMEKPQGYSQQQLALDQMFKDINPALSARQAGIESSRCYYCYDAPCITACPSKINIPSFIASIHADDLTGAAKTIYQENIMGGSCARVCPTEILCEQACVRNKEQEQAPVKIGLLQRHATDNAVFVGHPFKREAATGKTVAVVGAGPAGLSCAHRLAMLGNDVEIFEAASKAGGLNEYGIAKYKLTDNFAQKEVDFILSIGGITLHTETALGKDISLEQLKDQFDAVFLALGLQDVQSLMLVNEVHPQVINAVDFIRELRQASDLNQLDIPPESAVVIGAGNTAIDMACQLKRLGTEEVTLVYRRGEEQMSATKHEQQIAKNHQVRIKTWAKPEKINLDHDGVLRSMTFRKTYSEDGQLKDSDQTFDIACSAVFKAVGQKFAFPEKEQLIPTLSNGKITTVGQQVTSLDGVFAGGDCTAEGQDLTVEAVQQGKLAALAIHQHINSVEV
ncbi:NAD(P)-dependent oxidoreductase [Agarivorans albus]|uniref:dihydrouracil dehydrogenase (NAD(+)) n=1 Tax=Agarivorans albus MKT 106 TaxID=1331007 RepID=R9PKG9_AGAAL|nr:NAD(P)-dependent oxidoreductase [Agarivorans albus]GAD01842.1 pyridine nucleotide-disulphide oxidoreductase associated with reductive pyrimidine catabolism [Agarivorans albus MKT 106]